MLQRASNSIVDRAAKLAAVAETVEKDLIVLGATAIEDKLQVLSLLVSAIAVSTHTPAHDIVCLPVPDWTGGRSRDNPLTCTSRDKNMGPHW